MAAGLELIPSSQMMPSAIDTAERQFALINRRALAMSDSELVPTEYRGRVANCIIALEVAERVNASPLMVMQNLTIIHGKPSWSSTFIISAINSCGRFKPLRFRIKEDEEEKDFTYEIFETEWNNGKKATKTVKRVSKIRNQTCVAWTTDITGEVLESPAVSIEMACVEGWYDKSGSKWKTMPGLMLRYRSAAFFGRLYAPDVLMGMHADDEVVDYVDGPTIEGKVLDRDQGSAVQAAGEAGSNRVQSPAKITQDQAHEFAKAWKATGYTIDEAKTFLGARISVSSSLDITTDKYELAMSWAKKEGEFAEPTHLQKEIAAAFDILGWNDKEQARFADQYAGNGAQILAELNILVAKREAQE